MSDKIRLGMVGGGQGAFIGGVHRIAARIDARFELVAGALSSDPARAASSAREIGLARSYSDFSEMACAEAARADGIQAVAIVTPNHLHFAPAKAFLEAGIHVICDKPMTATLSEAKALVEIADKSAALFILTHTYAGYPMVREARRYVSEGILGNIRVVQVEYVQDWLTGETESKQAAWRLNPTLSGGGAIGDIGTHAAHLARFVSGLPITSVAADIQSFVPGRDVDDNCHILMRMGTTVRGMLWASQVAPGFDNDLRIRVIGDTGSLEWFHKTAEELRLTQLGTPTQILTRGGAGFQGRTRVPSGHPEGYLEAFANLYSDAADAIEAGAMPKGLPNAQDGLDGLQFINAVQRSHASGGVWTPLL